MGDRETFERRRAQLVEVVTSSGGNVVPADKANALMWLSVDNPSPVVTLLNENPGITWVQLPWAGVENFAAAGLFSRPITFTCAKGAYGGQVGEHALMLIMTSLRHVTEQARTLEWHRTEPELLEGKRVTVLGAGGITTSLVRFLRAADCDITVLRRSAADFPGATRTLPISELHAVLPDTEILVLALALTPETTQIIGAKELALLPPNAVLVNVARGSHVDTGPLVDALKNGQLAAAGLDVTDPEPLPKDHPLWSFDNVLITSHCADSQAYVTEKLAERLQENVIRFQDGEPLVGQVDLSAGY